MQKSGAVTETYCHGRCSSSLSLPLPKCNRLTSWTSADDRCVVQIFSTGQWDVSSWYHLWEAVTAVFSVCVRPNGQGGSYTGIGTLPFSSTFTCLLCGQGERKKEGGDVLTFASGDFGNIFLTVSSAAAAKGMQMTSLSANASVDATE